MLILSLNLTPLKFIMHSPVFTVGKDHTLSDAIKKMIKHDIGCIVVTDKGKAVGIITERDVMKLLGKSTPKTKKISSIMTKNIRTLSPLASISQAFSTMQQLRIRRLPLVDKNGNLEGIITERDIIGATNNYIRVHSKIQFVVSIVAFIGAIAFLLYWKLRM
jgi:CBS domain-containing protein